LILPATSPVTRDTHSIGGKVFLSSFPSNLQTSGQSVDGWLFRIATPATLTREPTSFVKW